MLASWDSDLRCQFANLAYRDWFGADPQRMLGTSIRELLGPNLFAQNEPYMRAALAGEAQVFERIIRTPSGVERHSLARYTPDFVDGVASGFFVEVTDVSHVKSRELSLRREVAALDIKRERVGPAKRQRSDQRKLELIQAIQREAA